MVYCTKCGLKNPDDAKHCSKCGSELGVVQKERSAEEWGEEFGKKMEKWGEDFGKQMEDWGDEFGRTIEEGCFRLPYLGVIIGIVIGTFLVIIGISLLIGLDLEVWGRQFGIGILIIIGLIIVIGAIYSLTRRRR